jgi:hypothetical protein
VSTQHSKIGSWLLTALAVFVTFVLTYGLIYNFTKDRTTNIAATILVMSAALGFLALIRAYIDGSPRRKRLGILLLLAVGCVVTAVLFAGGDKASASSSGDMFGGYEWSQSVERNSGYAALPGCGWVKIWHNGYSPFHIRVYTWWMKVDWCWTARLVNTKFGRVLGWKFVGQPQVQTGFDDAGTGLAHYQGEVPPAKNDWKTWNINLVKTTHGAMYIYRQAQVNQDVIGPFKVSSVTGFPAASVTITARGEVIAPWFSHTLLPW